MATRGISSRYIQPSSLTASSGGGNGEVLVDSSGNLAEVFDYTSAGETKVRTTSAGVVDIDVGDSTAIKVSNGLSTFLTNVRFNDHCKLYMGTDSDTFMEFTGVHQIHKTLSGNQLFQNHGGDTNFHMNTSDGVWRIYNSSGAVVFSVNQDGEVSCPSLSVSTNCVIGADLNVNVAADGIPTVLDRAFIDGEVAMSDVVMSVGAVSFDGTWMVRDSEAGVEIVNVSADTIVATYTGGAGFGKEVAIAGCGLYVGVLSDVALFIYYYDGSSWALQQEISVSGGAVAFDYYGANVAVRDMAGDHVKIYNRTLTSWSHAKTFNVINIENVSIWDGVLAATTSADLHKYNMSNDATSSVRVVGVIDHMSLVGDRAAVVAGGSVIVYTGMSVNGTITLEQTLTAPNGESFISAHISCGGTDLIVNSTWGVYYYRWRGNNWQLVQTVAATNSLVLPAIRLDSIILHNNGSLSRYNMFGHARRIQQVVASTSATVGSDVDCVYCTSSSNCTLALPVEIYEGKSLRVLCTNAITLTFTSTEQTIVNGVVATEAGSSLFIDYVSAADTYFVH